MAAKLNISFDSEMLESISAEFDLRTPNKEALRRLVFTLDGDYDPNIMQVLNLATGVGKTYLMAAFIEYLRRQGVGNVVIVTPGKTVQSKTVQNFTPGSSRYIVGSQVPPDIVTPQNYSAWISRINGPARLSFGREIPVLAFIFNIQQLIAPKSDEGDTLGKTQDAIRRKPRKFDENAGVLFDYLRELDDLVVIADESHLYSSSAVAFSAALRELDPAATIGLTASAGPKDEVVYKYPLYQAIKDRYVKAPVLAFRKGGYGTDTASEEQQLRDALQLRALKQAYYDVYAQQEGKPHLNAVAFVVCSDVDHASQVADLLRTPEYLGSQIAVLQVDSKHDDETTQKLLENLDQPTSPVLAVVSVNKLKEGWDVKNISVIVTLRAMASEVLTQQTMGRGLRLPFGKYTGLCQIDQLDIIAHQSFQELLAEENVLAQFGLEEALDQGDSTDVGVAVRSAFDHAAQNAGKSDSPAQEEGSPSFVETTPSANKNPFAPNVVTVSGSDVATIGVRAIADEQESGDNDMVFEVITISPNPRFANVSYSFPVTTIKIEQPAIDLSEIDDRDIEAAAEKVVSTGDVLFRKEIVAALGGRIRVRDAESAEVDSIRVSFEDAKTALVKLAASMQLVPSTAATVQYISSYLVPKFMKKTGLSEWTAKALESARE